MQKKLSEAAFRGDLPRLQTLVTRENINNFVTSCWTLLHIVVCEMHTHCVPFLLMNGADVTQIDTCSRTALDYAIQNNDIECCRLLISAWPRRNGMPIEIGFCPLEFSMMCCNFQAAVELTKQGWPIEQYYESFLDSKVRRLFITFFYRIAKVKNSIAALILTTREPRCALGRLIGKDMLHLVVKEMWESSF